MPKTSLSKNGLSKAGVVHGIRWALTAKGEYRFAVIDIATLFDTGVGEISKYVKMHRDLTVAGCKNTIDFPSFITVIKNIIVDNEAFKSLSSNLEEMVKGTDFENLYYKERDLRQAAELQIKVLKEALGDGEDYKIVAKIPWLGNVFRTRKDMGKLRQVLGGQLTRLSRDMKVRIRYAHAFGYGHTLNMYHYKVIEEFYRKLKSDRFYLSKWRWPTEIFEEKTFTV